MPSWPQLVFQAPSPPRHLCDLRCQHGPQTLALRGPWTQARSWQQTRWSQVAMQITQTGMAPAAAWPSDTDMAPDGGPAYTSPPSIGWVFDGLRSHKYQHPLYLWSLAPTSVRYISSSSGQVVTMAPGGYVGHSDWHGTVATQPLDTRRWPSHRFMQSPHW